MVANIENPAPLIVGNITGVTSTGFMSVEIAIVSFSGGPVCSLGAMRLREEKG
ncbi:MAG: hypothetical protein ABSG35_17585 [Syntrophobacteraceae bacterium]